MKILLKALVVMMVFTGCKDKNQVPSNVLKPSKMQDVMWDMFEAQSLAQQRANKDSSTTVAIETKKLSEEVFKIYGITEKKFNDSYHWYLNHPSLLNQMLDSLNSQKSEENRPIPDRPDLDRPEIKNARLKTPAKQIE